MPELPEVETVARGLAANITGDTIESSRVLRHESIAHPGVRAFGRAIAGRRVLGAGRRGKYVLVELSGGATLVVHLRMSGRLLIKAQGAAPDRFARVCFGLGSGRELHFEDMRVFGRLWLVAPDEDLESVVGGLAGLGVEPLDGLAPGYLQAAFAGKNQPVKSALLDQRIVAGIGNIYADESLFLAGINPTRRAGGLSKAEIARLCATICDVLRTAIERGGSSMRDYQNALGVNGNYLHEAWVYGRKGEPCRACRATIEQVRLAGRSTHFCPSCQKRKAGRKPTRL